MIINQNGCSDTSSCYNINTVEISENSFSIFTKIYPNPSTGKIQIIIDDLKFIKNCSIEIFNMQGVIIYQSEIINSKFDIEDDLKDIQNLIKLQLCSLPFFMKVCL